MLKLVPQYFPEAVGAVTGLVGAAGGLGGFFPPIALGLCRQTTGSFTIGFILLTVFALICFAICLDVRPRIREVTDAESVRTADASTVDA